MIWITLLFGLGSVLYLSVLRKGQASVESLVIHVQSKEGGKLIQENEVRKMVIKSIGFNPDKKSIKSINSRKLEADLFKDARIKNVEVYFDSKDRMHIRIIPKEVIVRISDATHKQYFLDESGNKVPVINGGALRVPLASGNIEPFTQGFENKTGKSALKDIFWIVKYIAKDDFLHALVEQIYVDPSGEIVLIPKVGKEKLIFGGAEQMEEKFENLKIFYRDGMTKIGWNRYPALNLKFVNQVVLVDGAPVSQLANGQNQNIQHQ